MTLKTIRLELARDKDHPQGDASHGYIFRAPIDDAGHLDVTHWSKNALLCTVHRLENGRTVETGSLQRAPRGRWIFSYAAGDADDESLFHLGDHVFAAGNYISITEHDGVQRTFRISAVEDWHPAAQAARVGKAGSAGSVR